MKNTGIELIAQERAEQIEKHGRSLSQDALSNKNGEMVQAAIFILNNYLSGYAPNSEYPRTWSSEFKFKMEKLKSKKEQLIIAAALIAAELDRLQDGE